MKKEIDWDHLRVKFFRECTDKPGGITKVSLAPHNVFEWFKKEIENRLK